MNVPLLRHTSILYLPRKRYSYRGEKERKTLKGQWQKTNIAPPYCWEMLHPGHRSHSDWRGWNIGTWQENRRERNWAQGQWLAAMQMQLFKHQICHWGNINPLKHNFPPKTIPAMTLILTKGITISRLMCELKWACKHMPKQARKELLTAKTCFLHFGHILWLFWLLS